MRLRKPIRTLLAVLAATVGVGGSAALSFAAPAAAAPAAPTAVCHFHMGELIAHNLLKDNGTDFVWLKLDQTFYPPGNDGLPFHQSDARDGGEFGIPASVGFPAGGLPIRLVFDTWPRNRVVGPETIPCDPGSDGSVEFEIPGVLYELTYTVT